MTAAAPVADGIDSYEKIVAYISELLGRGDLFDMIPNWIRMVEKELERDIHLRDGEHRENIDLVSGEEFVILPPRVKQLRHVRVNSSHAYSLNVVSIEKLNDVRTNGSALTLPSAMTIIGHELHMAPTPGTDDDITIIYFGAMPPLSAKNPRNQLTEDAPDLLIYGALAHSAPFIGDDERLTVWSGFFTRAKESYRLMEHRHRLGGGPLQVRPDVVPNDRHSFRGRGSGGT